MVHREALPSEAVLDRRYRLGEVIGSGGFGITYLAHDLGLDTPVAIKEYFPTQFATRDASYSVHPRSSSDKPSFERLRSSFIREARTLAQIDHPAVVRVLSVFETNGTAYMVMRYEAGPSMKAWLEGLGRRPTQAELDAIAEPLLAALEVMHGDDILHRDIAPDNIIIRPDQPPVLIDFGAARRLAGELSSTMTGIVKEGYSPQEQYSVNGKAQGPWSDIYSLGATLYAAVTGRKPAEATQRMLADDMVPASEVGAGHYRAEFLAAIDAALKLFPKERPQSIVAWREALLAGTELARPPVASASQSAAVPAGARAPTAAMAAPEVSKPAAGSAGSSRLGRLAAGIALLLALAGGGAYLAGSGNGFRPAGGGGGSPTSGGVAPQDRAAASGGAVSDSQVAGRIGVGSEVVTKGGEPAATSAAGASSPAGEVRTAQVQAVEPAMPVADRVEPEAAASPGSPAPSAASAPNAPTPPEGEVQATPAARAGEDAAAAERAAAEEEALRQEHARAAAQAEAEQARAKAENEAQARAKAAADAAAAQAVARAQAAERERIEAELVAIRERLQTQAETLRKAQEESRLARLAAEKAKQAADQEAADARERGRKHAAASAGGEEAPAKPKTRVASLSKPDDEASGSGSGRFDGRWTLTRIGENCRAGRVRSFSFRIAGGETTNGKGSVSAAGRFKYRGKSKIGDKPVHFSGSLNGSSGRGTFYVEGGRCEGTFTVSRN